MGKPTKSTRDQINIAPTVYTALITSVLDYGCVAYGSASKTQLSRLDQICSTPTPTVQVEMGEMPLELRRHRIPMSRWVKWHGHDEAHPVMRVMQTCCYDGEWG